METAVKAAGSAGEIIMKNLGHLSKRDIGHKRRFDLVTRVDKESEEAIIGTIRKPYPAHKILSEEGINERGGEFRWIIDPLDGTTNYVHGYPVFSVSIALEHKGEVKLGVVLDPIRSELFTAIKDQGAFLNGKPIAVSEVSGMAEGLIATGFPFRNKDQIDSYLKVFKDLFLRVSDIRRAGSAVVDLAYLSCGRNNGFFELGLFPWDLAAGSLSVKEAGGVVTDFGGGQHYLSTGNIVAGTKKTHKELLKAVKKVFHGQINR